MTSHWVAGLVEMTSWTSLQVDLQGWKTLHDVTNPTLVTFPLCCFAFGAAIHYYANLYNIVWPADLMVTIARVCRPYGYYYSVRPNCINLRPTFFRPCFPGLAFGNMTTATRLPIGPGDILIEFGPNRGQCGLPDIYETLYHPKWQGPGRIFYYLEDTSKASLSKIAQLEKTLKIPQGSEEQALALGWVHYDCWSMISQWICRFL